MTPVVKRANVHEGTVQQAEELARKAKPPRHRKPRQSAPLVALTKAHPLVVEKARALLRPGQRVRVLSPTEVIVENVRSDG